MDINQSLISKRDSTLLKGILILLIILGHNSILMQTGDKAIYYYLYHFHVYIFLLLPFLYNIPELTAARVKKDFIHIYKPYTLIFIVLIVINTFVLNNKFNLGTTLYAYISANEYLLRENIGASFLWFMPTMFSLLFLRNLLLRQKAGLLWTCAAISLLAFIATRVIWIATVYDYPYIIMGGTVSIVYFSIAVIGRFIYERYCNCRYFSHISFIVFVLATIVNFTDIRGVAYNIVTWGILPISALYTFIAIVKLLKENNLLTRCLDYLGKESLPIYLFHVIIYNAILLAVDKMHIAHNFFTGTLSYIITLAISIAAIWVCKKASIYKLMFN